MTADELRPQDMQEVQLKLRASEPEQAWERGEHWQASALVSERESMREREERVRERERRERE